jgi:hypothetical protein
MSLVTDDEREDRKYRVALLNSQYYFIIGDGQGVALADWNSDNCEVYSNKYRIIIALQFLDADHHPTTLLHCSCSETVNFLLSLDRTIPVAFRELAEFRRQYCRHCKVVVSLGLEIRQYEESESLVEVEIEQHLADPNLLWSVRSSSGPYGMVKRSKRGILSCITCDTKRG